MGILDIIVVAICLVGLAFIIPLLIACMNGKSAEVGQVLSQAIKKGQDDWRASREAKQKKGEETGNAIASILANIMKKRS